MVSTFTAPLLLATQVPAGHFGQKMSWPWPRASIGCLCALGQGTPGLRGEVEELLAVAAVASKEVPEQAELALALDGDKRPSDFRPANLRQLERSWL